jgi:hypothetical protein
MCRRWGACRVAVIGLSVLPETKFRVLGNTVVQPGALRGFTPVEGVAEDQAEGDVAVPEAQAYRPERSVWSEGETSPFFCLIFCVIR